ncbi:tRNA (guanine-N(1)-)-methyltransferase [compost metagenome]
MLISGHHDNINKWRNQQSLIRTLERRPDLLEGRQLSKEEKKWMAQWQEEQRAKESGIGE